MDTDSYSLLLSLKGARLHVLVAIRLFFRPVTESALATLTGYSRQTCAVALRDLTGLGYVEQRHYRGWQLSTVALQLPLWTEGELEGSGVLDVADQLLLDDAQAAAPRVLHAATADLSLALATVEKPNTQPTLVASVKTEPASAPSVRKPDTQDSNAVAGERKPNFQPPCGGCCLRTVNTLNRVKEQQPPVSAVAGAAGERKPNIQQPNVTKTATPAPATPAMIKDARIVKNVKTPAALPVRTTTPRLPAPPAHQSLTPAEAALLDDLVTLTACPRPRALAAITAARAAGHSTGTLHREVLYWHAYIASPRGRTILNPGYFVASRLEAGIPCPFADVAFRHLSKLAALNSLLAERASIAKTPAGVGPTGEVLAPEPLEPEAAPPAPPDPDRELAESLRRHLQLQLPHASYDTWVRDAWFSRRDGNLLIYHADAYARDWLSKRLLPLIKRTAAGLLGVAPNDLTVEVLAQSPLAEVML